MNLEIPIKENKQKKIINDNGQRYDHSEKNDTKVKGSLACNLQILSRIGQHDTPMLTVKIITQLKMLLFIIMITKIAK